MTGDIYAIVTNVSTCAKNRLKLRRVLNPLKLFPATRPLTDLCIDNLGPLTKSKHVYKFLLVITDRLSGEFREFTKLTQVVPLPCINAYTFALASTENCLFKHGAHVWGMKRTAV